MKEYEAPVIEIEEFDVAQIMESGPNLPVLPF